MRGVRDRDQGEVLGGSRGSGEDLGQIQGKSMRSGIAGTREGSRGVWGSKECLGVPREVLGDRGTRENVTPNSVPKSYKERHGLSKTIVLTPPFHLHTSTNCYGTTGPLSISQVTRELCKPGTGLLTICATRQGPRPQGSQPRDHHHHLSLT